MRGWKDCISLGLTHTLPQRSPASCCALPVFQGRFACACGGYGGCWQVAGVCMCVCVYVCVCVCVCVCVLMVTHFVFTSLFGVYEYM